MLSANFFGEQSDRLQLDESAEKTNEERKMRDISSAAKRNALFSFCNRHLQIVLNRHQIHFQSKENLYKWISRGISYQSPKDELFSPNITRVFPKWLNAIQSWKDTVYCIWELKAD